MRNKRIILIILTGLLVLSALLSAAEKGPAPKSVQWFQDAKFGMFIHWGVYSILGRGEWVMHNERIPIREYEKLPPQFNPVQFSAKEWVALAKEAGQKYITITSKHHDGFCMFDSALTDYKITNTPFKRDPLAELAKECHKQGIKLFFYYSILDWHHPHYAPRPAWQTDPPGHQRDFAKYLKYYQGQIKELCTKYGKLGGIWFDGGWEHNPEELEAPKVIDLIRRLQPEGLINDRTGLPADFGTPEQQIPPSLLPKGRLWETCMTINNNWGYHKDDHNHKSVPQLIRTLVEVVGKGGNLLLNVGPMPTGKIQPEFVERLKAVGAWLKKNGEAIYGTRAGPWTPSDWGYSVWKGQKIYLHILNWPGKELILEGLKNKIKSAALLKGPKLKFSQNQDVITIQLPESAKDPIDTIVVLEVSEKLGEFIAKVFPLSAHQPTVLKARDAELVGSVIRYEPDKDCAGFWTNAKDYVKWKVRTKAPFSCGVEITYACDKGVGGSEYVIRFGNQKITGKVKETGSWTNFITEPLGRIEVPSGESEVVVKPLFMPSFAVMNLREITLKPVK